MNTNKSIEDVVNEFKSKLEDELDKGFPKIHEEGEEKRLNKRGHALGLYSVAVLLFKESLTSLVQQSKEEERARMSQHSCKASLGKCEICLHIDSLPNTPTT